MVVFSEERLIASLEVRKLFLILKTQKKVEITSTSERRSEERSSIRYRSDREECHQKRQLEQGFSRCLTVWFQKEFQTFRDSNVVDREFLWNHFKKFEPVEKVKAFKYLLCYNFSKLMNQELPVGKEEYKVNILRMFRRVPRLMLTARLNLVRLKPRLCWNLLQCKTVSNTVPRAFILEAYEKHHQVMNQISPNLADELINEIRQFVRPWVSKVKEIYQDKTHLPSNHACSKVNRDAGGLKKALESQFYRGSGMTWDPTERKEPIVIHLEGRAGVGKSRTVEVMAKKIGAQFGLFGNFRDWTYYRSSATQHWDGYHQQLITVIDDFCFEDLSSRTQTLEPSSKEILQLVSDCDYIVPMADLREKGTRFTSPFLILTSNRARDMQVGQHFAEPDAFYRRISPTYEFVQLQTKSIKIVQSDYLMDPIDVMCRTDMMNSHYPVTNQHGSKWVKSGVKSIQQIVEFGLQRYNERYGNLPWLQRLSESTADAPEFGLQFAQYPPRINEVVAFAIPEPLKVRMITKPDPNAYALKPLQKAMFEALKIFPCFTPCFQPDFDLNSLLRYKEGELLLSGDYTAATDELNFNASQAVLQCLIEEFDDHPILQRYIEWEGGSHLVTYPKWTGLTPAYQECGQLMGSLLSFPILSILNAFTICKATGQPLEEVRAVFHGDDIAAVVENEGQYESWKSVANLVGLQLSIGKNYLSRQFVSIDSQLYLVREGHLKRQLTGKFKLLYRTEGEQLTCEHALRNGFSKDLLRRYCGQELKRTIRSLDVSVAHGGLGLETSPNRPLSLYDKGIYRVLVANKNKIQPLGNGLYRVLKETARMFRLPEVELPLEDEPKQVPETTLERDVKKLIARAGKSSELARWLKNTRLDRELSSFVRTTIRYDGSLSELVACQGSLLGCLVRPMGERQMSLHREKNRLEHQRTERSVCQWRSTRRIPKDRKGQSPLAK
nr:MAG: putative RNA-dependent RNA polymerase [Narnaviridae sp.]